MIYVSDILANAVFGFDETANGNVAPVLVLRGNQTGLSYPSALITASIAGPLFFSTFYLVVRDRWPGAIWLFALVVNAMSDPLVLSLRFQSLIKPETY